MLANGPVGPRGYSPELAELAGELGPDWTYVLAPVELLDDQHGLDYLLWELRGNRICVEAFEGGLRHAGTGLDLDGGNRRLRGPWFPKAPTSIAAAARVRAR